VTYHLRGTVGGGSVATFGAVDVTRAGVRGWLAEEDDALPGARALLRGGAPDGLVPPGSTWRVCLVKYRPRRRCVVRLDAVDGQAPLFGKVFADGLTRHHAALMGLAAAPEGPRVMAPVGHWPELGLLVQRAIVPGTSLAGLAKQDEDTGARWMRRAGRSVGLLHRVAWRPSQRVTLRDDLREVAQHRILFERLAPHLTERFDTVLARAVQDADGLEEQVAVTSHGALRADQLLVDGDDGLVLVDLDSCCLASPARDVANLLAYLEWSAVRDPERRDAVAAASNGFLEGYAGVAEAPDAEVLAVYRSASLLRIAGRRLRRLETGWWPLLQTLLDRAAAKDAE
jgi:hypothetical protein